MGSLAEVFQTALANIETARGLEMTFAGLTITFSALASVAIFISFLPKILFVLNKIVPEKNAHHEAKPTPGITEDIVAAICLAHHSLKSTGK
jgi:hypothetical protein